MRIGIYDPYLDDLGGGEKYMMTIAECLAEKHEVSVFWDNLKDVQALTERFSLNFEKISFKKNIFTPETSFLTRFLTTREYDAVIFLSDGSIPLVSSKKLFIHLQQPLDQIDDSSWKDKIKHLRITKAFCNSEFTKSFNEKKLGAVKTVVISPPVSLLQKNIKKENIILTVGRFRVINVKVDDYKKQQVMINEFKKMVKDGLKDWKFVVATSIRNTEDSRFQEMIKSAKGYPIEFQINKTNNQLWDVYNRAKIYWHASGFDEDLVKNPEFAEHFGISTVEAMGSGAVPVVFNAGGQKEIVFDGKNGLVWNTLEELHTKTKELIHNKVRLEKMSQAARIRAKYFSKERFCEAMQQLVTE